LIPSGFFDDVFDAAAGTDLTLVSVRTTPAVTIDGESHPGYAPSVLQFPVRAGEGFPTILSVTATTMDDEENSTLTVVAIGPNDGTGRVEIRSISGLPDDLQGTIELVEPVSCPAPNKQPVECTAELDASFTANRTVELDVDLAISGDRTKTPGKSILGSVPITLEMTRPLSTASFISKLLQLLALFVAVQVLLRALFTTRLARWDGVAPNSRWKTLPVTVGPDGTVSAVGGGVLTVDPTTTMFATELEGRNSRAVIDDVHFEISWLRTFIGERQETGFGRSQRAVIRATAATNHCIAPEGSEPAKEAGPSAGLVGTTFRECWVLQVPTGVISTLASGETASAQLLVVFKPFEGGPSAADQLDEVSDRLNDVTAREIPRLIEAGQVDQSTGAVEADEIRTGEAVVTKGTDRDDDPFDKPVADPTDPFDDSPTSTSSGSTEPSEWDDQVHDPDDPFA
jgi:hypothetical protein